MVRRMVLICWFRRPVAPTRAAALLTVSVSSTSAESGSPTLETAPNCNHRPGLGSGRHAWRQPRPHVTAVTSLGASGSAALQLFQPAAPLQLAPRIALAFLEVFLEVGARGH